MKTVTKNIEISFISFPPAIVATPSPALSVLKTFLKNRGILSEIIYVNHFVDSTSDFFNEKLTNDLEAVLPFMNLFNDNFENEKYVEIHMKGLFPDIFLTDRSLIREIKNEFISQYKKVLDDITQRLKENGSKMVGFTSKFYQWLPASTFFPKLKQELPHIKIVVGGWPHKQAAMSFLKLNPDVDFCIWGEGEIPLYSLYSAVNGNGALELVPRLAYRSNNIKATSQMQTETYVDLNEYSSGIDYSDYFKSKSNAVDKNTLIPIERGRSCHWNKCSFCYLSQGYKFRLKKNSSVLKEINNIIKKYNCANFFFTDNDIIGGDIESFNDLLDGLIELKRKIPKFRITMAEIISNKVDRTTIQKMKKAGFENIQVGVETISESIMKDINKKQSVVENYFFISEAIANNIKIKGANIIIDTPNETDSMVMEAINNLHSFRFLLNNEEFTFEIIPLGVSNYSRYLSQIKKKNETDLWSISEWIQVIPQKYYDDIDRFSILEFVKNSAEPPLWRVFSRVLAYYKRKKFSYEVNYSDNRKDCLIYKEYSDTSLIKEILIDNSTQIKILQILKDVYKVDELRNKVINSNLNTDVQDFEDLLFELIEEDLIKYDKVNKQVVSIIKIPD